MPNNAALDGAVSDNGLINAPGATTSIWSRVSGPDDCPTRPPTDKDNQHVARFNNINPGDEGRVVLNVSWDGSSGGACKGKYGSIVMLQRGMRDRSLE